MKNATVATYDEYHSKSQLDRNTCQVGQRPRKYLDDRTLYLINTTDGSGNQPFSGMYADRQVREDRGFYIPDFLSDEQYDSDPEAYAAAVDNAKHLRKAERVLGEALNLVGLLLASLGDEGDSRAMQIDTALRVIEKKLSSAYNQIDKHDTRYTNLFFAYFDLKGRTEGGAE